MSEYSADRDALAVDEYISQQLELADPVLEAGRRRAHEAGLPHIEVSAAQGKLLMILAELLGARRVLEVGTLGGFSTSWLARGVGSEGKVISCEFEPLHAKVATQNLEDAQLADRVDILVGAATQSMRGLIEQQAAPFDMIFIDADKRNNVNYLELGLQLSRPGTLIIVDNVVRGGAILDEAQTHGDAAEDLRGVQQTYRWLAQDPRVEATALQTVGSKGWDGLAIVRVR